MPQVERSIDIQAPVERVFDLIANQPERQPEWWPPIESTQRVTPPPTAVGSVSNYVYNMLGVRIRGEHQVVEMVPNQHLLVKTISGIDSAFTFTFAPAPGGTKLKIQVDYAVPGSVLGQLVNKLAIEQKNISDLETGLQNLKGILE